MKTDPELAGFLIYQTDSAGLITEALTSGNLATNASKFAIGCILTDTTTGKIYANRGSVALPSWNSISEITSSELDAGLVQQVIVPLTAAQINALFTTSIEIIPAVAGKSIILDSFVFDLAATATQFAGGGVVNLQYKNTANGAGAALHADIAAATITGATGRTIVQRIPLVAGSAIVTADITGVGVFIGAKTAVFTTGTGTANCIVNYHLV